MAPVSGDWRKRLSSPVLFASVLTGLVAGTVLLLSSLGYASTGGANPAPSQYQYQGQDFVTGSGTATFANFPNPGDSTTEQFIVSAHSGPLGEDPHGQITFHSPLLDSKQAKADVTCMVVTGSRARVGGIFDKPVFYAGDGPFRWFELIVQDNGPPGHGVPDMMNALIFLVRTHPPDFDPCTVDGSADFPLDQGNFTVKDAVPTP